jgi:hypothetical protein
MIPRGKDAFQLCAWICSHVIFTWYLNRTSFVLFCHVLQSENYVIFTQQSVPLMLIIMPFFEFHSITWKNDALRIWFRLGYLIWEPEV